MFVSVQSLNPLNHRHMNIIRNLRNFWIHSMALAVFVLGSQAQEPGSQTQHHFTKTITTEIKLGFLLDLPGDYDAEGDKKWPMMLFLHGAGERGSDLSMVAKHGPPRLAPARNGTFPFILVSPQCPSGERWEPSALVQLVDHIASKYAVDTKRIYVTGLSMGGYGTWALITNHPEKFAAAAPICGGGDPISILLANSQRRGQIASLPIWNFHGLKDDVVLPQRSEVMVEAISNIGGKIRYTAYPDAGHDSWTETYNNPDLYTWFLSHSR